MWVKSKNETDYNTHKIACKNTKRIIKKSKEHSWETYGQHLTKVCKESPRDFYKCVKSMRLREDNFNPSIIINDRNGNPLYKET